jgi:hypothetical protein
MCLAGFCVHWCGFRSVSSDLWLPSLATFVVSSFGSSARPLYICLLQQVILRQVLHGSGDGGARMAAHLQLLSMFVVLSRWSKDLHVIFFITFESICIDIDDY